MKRRLAAITAATIMALASVAVAAAVTVVDDDEGPWVGHDEMTSWRSSDRDDPRAAGQPPGWRVRGHLGPGVMHRTGVDSEYTYLTAMVAHHQEAVDSARHLQRSRRPEMRAFGRSIVTAQSAQIVQMKRWLADWYPDQSTGVEYQPMMGDLAALSGDHLDRAFLRDMVGHHMEAVMMSQQLLARGVAEHEQVKALAASIRDEQHAEITLMQQWLLDWFGGGLQHGHMSGT